MTTILYDADISGEGVFDNGGQFVIDHIAVTVLDVGPSVDSPRADMLDYRVRVGFVAGGFPLNEGAGDFDFWGEPHWIHWEHALIADFTTNEQTLWKVRWSLSPGTTAHLIVAA